MAVIRDGDLLGVHANVSHDGLCVVSVIADESLPRRRVLALAHEVGAAAAAWSLVGADLFTLPVGLAQLQIKNTSNEAQIMAGTVLTALPMIIVFLFMQRQFIAGMTAGALKE